MNHFSWQIKGLHTFIRDANTTRDEFIFYSNRLIRLVIEYALSMMPFNDVKVETPQNITYSGKRMSSNRICGVSILRAGETMEQAVSEVCKNIRIGKILIQTNQQTGEPEVGSMRFIAYYSLITFLLPAILFKTPKRYQRLSCYTDGCHRCNRGCRHHGDSRFT